MSLENNPFLSLFNSSEDADRHVKQICSSAKEAADTASSTVFTGKQAEQINDYLLENIFLLAKRQDFSENPHMLCLTDLKNLNTENVKEGNLAYFVCERLMAVEEIREMFLTRPELENSPAHETDPLKYLTECAIRFMKKLPKSVKPIERQIERSWDEGTMWRNCWQVIRDQAVLFLEVVDILPAYLPSGHLCRLLLNNTLSNPEAEGQLRFYALLANYMGLEPEQGEGNSPRYNIARVLDVFRPLLIDLLKEMEKQKEVNYLLFQFPRGLFFFTRNAPLALALIEFEKEVIQSTNKYEKSLLGSIFSMGSDPKFFNIVSDYLDDARMLTQQFVDNLESSVHRYLAEIQVGMYELFHTLLKMGGEVKKELLIWIGDAIHSNKDKTKLWNIHVSLFITNSSADNFLLNLQAVLLKLYSPIISDPNTSKILQIQPTYCSATLGDQKLAQARKVHMKDISHTRLVPANDATSNNNTTGTPSSTTTTQPTFFQTTTISSPLPATTPSSQSSPPLPSSSLNDNYSFTTEMFFMIHSCFSVGFSVMHEKFVKVNQEIHQIRERYKELVDQGLGSSDAGMRLKEQLQIAFPVFYTYRAALLQPELIEKSFQFSILSANFLVHVAMSTDTIGNHEIKERRQVVFPPPTDTSHTCLHHTPEFAVQNIHNCLLVLRRFKDGFFEENHKSLGGLFDFILLFMSGPQFIHNPHLRAEMAEALECLFPKNDNIHPNQSMFNTMQPSNFYREKLLVDHKNSKHVTSSLMRLFVGMELTGHGVQFENKFRYRQPMYVMFKYLWKLNIHQDSLKDLATHAEGHLDDMDAPLFLRFINLLINDAIYLLDEALSLMSQIKEKQISKEGGEWDNLLPNQRMEIENSFRHIVLLARFHNIMGIETIETLALLTLNVQSIFTHPVMVDRLASMLNYFLLHLVGPKKRHLNVKNPEEYKFEPKKLVVEICQIYENLCEDESFLRAISRDGRSYSQELFEQTSKVLCKIKQPVHMITKFNQLSARIKELAAEQAEEDEILADTPDDFLDPIMGTLMKDPVLLPSSGKIVDRQTIARHILSDQSDPFNRQPLTMDMIKPAEELKVKVAEWISKNRKS